MEQKLIDLINSLIALANLQGLDAQNPKSITITEDSVSVPIIVAYTEPDVRELNSCWICAEPKNECRGLIYKFDGNMWRQIKTHGEIFKNKLNTLDRGMDGSNLDSLTMSVNSLKLNLSVLQNAVTINVGTLNNQGNSINSLTTTTANLHQRLNTLDSTVTALDNLGKVVADKIDPICLELDSVKEYKLTLDKMLTTVNSLSSSVEAIKLKHKELSLSVLGLQKFDGQEAVLDTLSTRISNLEADKTDSVTKEFGVYKNMLERVDHDVNQLKNNTPIAVPDYADAIYGLNKSVETLHTFIDVLSSEHAVDKGGFDKSVGR